MYRELVCSSTEVVVSPPYVFLPLVKSSLRPDFHVAAQNCWVKKGGAFTGEVRYALMIFISWPSILFVLTIRHMELMNIYCLWDLNFQMLKLVLLMCSAEMLVNLGIPWVILGHSERRSLLNESNEVSLCCMA